MSSVCVGLQLLPRRVLRVRHSVHARAARPLDPRLGETRLIRLGVRPPRRPKGHHGGVALAVPLEQRTHRLVRLHARGEWHHVHAYLRVGGIHGVQIGVPQAAELQRERAALGEQRAAARCARDRGDCLLLANLVRADDEQRARLAAQLGGCDGGETSQRVWLRWEAPARRGVGRVEIEDVHRKGRRGGGGVGGLGGSGGGGGGGGGSPGGGGGG
mmetsp:Transcript_15295/g.49251  ORF Transcript_15295/g.49251 Transcript_15295/m.49251 type:complete len:215 (-) Transcript_15295:67-711(-)